MKRLLYLWALYFHCTIIKAQSIPYADSIWVLFRENTIAIDTSYEHDLATNLDDQVITINHITISTRQDINNTQISRDISWNNIKASFALNQHPVTFYWSKDVPRYFLFWLIFIDKKWVYLSWPYLTEFADIMYKSSYPGNK